MRMIDRRDPDGGDLTVVAAAFRVDVREILEQLGDVVEVAVAKGDKCSGTTRRASLEQVFSFIAKGNLVERSSVAGISKREVVGHRGRSKRSDVRDVIRDGGAEGSWLPSRKLRVTRQPGTISGVLILKILASAIARERLSAISSGSPIALISYLETSSGLGRQSSPGSNWRGSSRL